MPSEDVIELSGEREGYRVGVVQRFPPEQYGPTAEIWIELIRGGPPHSLRRAVAQGGDLGVLDAAGRKQDDPRVSGIDLTAKLRLKERHFQTLPSNACTLFAL